MSQDFFPPRPASRPTIYAYEDTNPQYTGLLKVGYTTVDAQKRVAQQYPTVRPGKPPYRIVLEESAMRGDGTVFTDHDVHRMLRLNVFNSALMNDAVYKFKRYEDASLEYTGINKHKDEDIGLYDTVLSRKDYQATFVNETTSLGDMDSLRPLR